MKSIVHSAWQILGTQQFLQNKTCKNKNPVPNQGQEATIIYGLDRVRDFDSHDLTQLVQQHSKVWQTALPKSAC